MKCLNTSGFTSQCSMTSIYSLARPYHQCYTPCDHYLKIPGCSTLTQRGKPPKIGWEACRSSGDGLRSDLEERCGLDSAHDSATIVVGLGSTGSEKSALKGPDTLQAHEGQPGGHGLYLGRPGPSPVSNTTTEPPEALTSLACSVQTRIFRAKRTAGMDSQREKTSSFIRHGEDPPDETSAVC